MTAQLPKQLPRIVSIAALLAAVVALAAILSGSSNTYVVRAVFADAGGMITGFHVRIDGAPVGTVSDMRLTPQGRVIATLELDPSAAPIGMGATATVRAADLLGEQYVALDPGNRADPAPSGFTIPVSHTGQAVELDDVLNSLDPTTTAELRVLLNESGLAFAGRGQNLAQVLSVLPPSLDQTRQLLGQLGQDNASLGTLVAESCRVVGAVAAQRAPLDRLVGSAAGTLHVLAGRRSELAQTVAQAPATLTALRQALAALQGAAIPLGPAAQGLAATAPQLNATLEQLPQFATAAAPTLATIRQISPALVQLGRAGTPVVRRLAPLTSELDTFSTALGPVTKLLDGAGIDNVLGVMEGWARATQARDAEGHVFRFGLTVAPATFSSLASLFATARHPHAHATGRPAARPQPAAATPAAAPGPTSTQPAVPGGRGLNKVIGIVKNLPSTVSKVTGTVSSTVSQTLQNLGVPQGVQKTTSSLQGLLNYLLK